MAIAIIPARGASKRIPRKNLLPLAGLPLIAHTVRHAVEASLVSETYVSTDDEEVAAVSLAHGAEVIRRPPELARDDATSESVLLHVLDERRRRGLPDPDLVVFLQCTSPVRAPEDVDRAIETLLAEGADSLFSANENRWLFWTFRDGRAYPINYDVDHRLREQDIAGQWHENGSIYVVRPEVLRERGNRLGGSIAIYRMDYWSQFQIDRPEDARLVDWILTEIQPVTPIS